MYYFCHQLQPKPQPVAELLAEFCSVEYQPKNIRLSECSFTYRHPKTRRKKIAKLIENAATNLTINVAYILHAFFEMLLLLTVCHQNSVFNCHRPVRSAIIFVSYVQYTPPTNKRS